MDLPFFSGTLHGILKIRVHNKQGSPLKSFALIASLRLEIQKAMSGHVMQVIMEYIEGGFQQTNNDCNPMWMADKR